MMGRIALQCAGCGTSILFDLAEGRPEGWRVTDATWCPDCAWLS